MKIEVAGNRYTRFVAASCVLRLDALSNTFAFEATSEKGIPLPFVGGEACKIFVDDEQVLSGFIEIVNASGSSSDHTIDVQGRDKTGDLLDSTIGGLGDIRPPIRLSTIVRKVIDHIGADIDVIDLANPDLFNKAEDLAAPEPGQNAMDFLEALARKRQVLMTSDPDGNVVITRSSGEKIGASVIHRVSGDGNNVLEYSVSYDTTGIFNLYQVRAQLNPLPLSAAGVTGAASVVDQSATQRDQDIREGRQYVLVAENQSSSSDASDRATWEANVRKARGRIYSATVSGFRNQAGSLWTPNTLVSVVDEYARIEAEMLVNTVTFKMDDSDGRITVLSLVNRNAYTLELEEPITDKVGDGLGSLG